MLKKGLLVVVGVLLLAFIGLLLLIQLVPYGKAHTNPPVVTEPNWDSPQTRDLAKRACFDCHSNETVWPWYSNVAPVSWLVQRDVEEGRQHLNFSDINSQQRFERRGGEEHEHGNPEEIEEVISSGEMPPWYYIIQHPDAKLTDAEKQQLIQGLQASLPQH